MRRVCAWCQAELAADGASSDAPVSHGICAGCADEFLADDVSLKTMLDRLGVPVVAVDADGRLLTASREAGEALGRSASELAGMKGGEAMACNHARLPGGCGQTVHCRTCTIRRTVMDSHEHGRSHTGVSAVQDQVCGGGTQRMEYRISTERVGKVVLLKIDDARAVERVGSTQA